MKIEVKPKNTEQEEIKYPWIGYGHYSMVLFSAYGTGIVLQSSQYIEGQYSTNWNMADFKKFEGTITLEND